MVESILLTMFHLRRVQFQAYVKEAKGRPVVESINDATEPSGIPAVRERSTMILLDKQTKIGRNPELVDVVLHSVVHSNMISRDHSEIVGETDGKGQFVRYYISDRSLNGTYVNDTRVKENVLLREGDLIKFGHVNGAAIKPGEHAPQHTAEFIFRFERSLPNFAYFGYSQKGARVHQHQSEHPQLQRRAYMQINSDRVLPTEVYASLAAAAAAAGASATGVGGGHGTVPRPIVSGCPAAVNSSSSATSGVTTAATSTSAPAAAHSSTAASFHPLHHSSSSASNNNTTTAASVNPSGCANASTNNNGAQLAHLAAVAAATTLANTVAAAAVATNGTAQQQRNQANGGTIDAATTSAASTLNALNQLGLTSATEEQVAAVNAHLRQLMASHDAMSAMERLAAQQQWNNSLLKLSSLQQQNPLVYGHAFPAAAAAAAALFTGCIDLNSAAANNPNSAAAQYAASLWPSIRALQPSVSQSADWAQQQKAAAFAQQLQLRLPGLYQQQQQQQQVANVVQHRGSSVTLPNAAPSLFGTPSAFSLPGSHTNSAATLLPSSSAGLLIAAQQQCVSTSSSTAYASCTSSATSAVGIPPMRHPGESPISSLSRGTSSVSLSLHPAQGTSVVDQQQNSTVALAARLAAAQQLAKELEADQHAKNSNNSIPGWSMGISCSSAAGSSVPVTKVSPLIGSSNGGGAADAGLGGATTPLQRIPGIASALAAAVVAAQQQHQQHNMPPWPSGTPPNNGLHPPLDTPPIRQPLAQRIFSPAVSNSSNLSLSSGSSKSSSGVSSAPSSGLLQSPGTCGGGAAIGALNNSDVGKEFRDSFSSLLTTNCSSTSAFSSPQTANNTNLNTLTTAMFAAEREKVNASRHRTTTSNNSALDEVVVAKVMTDDEKELAEGEQNEAPQKTTTPPPPAEWEKSDRELCNQQQQRQSLLIDQKTSLNGFSSSMSSDLDQLRMETSGSKMNNDDDHEDPRKADEMASCEEKREQMECDSSVPSPPPGREQQQQQQQLNLLEKESTGEDCKTQREKASADLPAELSSLRKRHSSAGSSLSPTDESIDAGGDGGKAEKEKSGSTKPRPIKQARKSNEVARLLNDLTAGNCSWQYMAERSQKLAAKQTNGSSGGGKSGGGRGDGADSPAAETTEKGGRMGMEKVQHQQQQQQLSSQSARTERKRPLRLEERKRAEIERKRAHKMMRQISDESSDEEHNGGGGGKRENVPNNGNSVGQNVQKQQQRHNNISKNIASPHLSSSDEDDDGGRKSPDLDSNDSDHQHQRQRHANSSRRRRKGSGDAKGKEHSPAKALTNGGTVPKRKLLSSAPGTKKAATMAPMNSVPTTTTTKLANGGPKNSEVPRKRGPKGGAEEKVKAAAVRSLKPKTNAVVVATSTALALKKKAGRKTGNGRGRPAGNLQKAADGTSETGDSSDDDSSVDQPVRLSNGSRGPMLNGGGPTLIREETRTKGRHRGRRRDESSPDLATTTVAEDWTGGSGDPELCAHKGCQRPLHMAINWVQCDDCDQWFHSTCVFGTNKTPDGDVDFHCGCGGTDCNNSTKTSTDNNKVANNAKSSSTASISSSA
uniref:FHA domain-containing protein n=1 Tax=Globodera rostochiensis TaxID=31243 RepID=A0A914HBV0_GLORO